MAAGCGTRPCCELLLRGYDDGCLLPAELLEPAAHKSERAVLRDCTGRAGCGLSPLQAVQTLDCIEQTFGQSP